MATGGVSTPDSRQPGNSDELPDRQLQALAGKFFHVVLKKHKARGGQTVRLGTCICHHTVRRNAAVCGDFCGIHLPHEALGNLLSTNKTMLWP